MRNIALRCQVVCLLAVSVFYAQSMVAQESPSAAKGCIRAAKYTVDGGARGMREVFRSASWPPRLWA